MYLFCFFLIFYFFLTNPRLGSVPNLLIFGDFWSFFWLGQKKECQGLSWDAHGTLAVRRLTPSQLSTSLLLMVVVYRRMQHDPRCLLKGMPMKGFLTSTRESHEAKLLTTTNGYYETYTAVQNKSVKTWPRWRPQLRPRLWPQPRRRPQRLGGCGFFFPATHFWTSPNDSLHDFASVKHVFSFVRPLELFF